MNLHDPDASGPTRPEASKTPSTPSSNGKAGSASSAEPENPRPFLDPFDHPEQEEKWPLGKE